MNHDSIGLKAAVSVHLHITHNHSLNQSKCIRTQSSMSFGTKDTSLITILSSEHGRLRREQRDIDKRDLQKALKHGSRNKAWNDRWRIEYDGITFITDPTMRREVTAYPSPLPDYPVDHSMVTDHNKAKLILRKKPELSTTHTVIIIDNSGSMLDKKNDIHFIGIAKMLHSASPHSSSWQSSCSTRLPSTQTWFH